VAVSLDDTSPGDTPDHAFDWLSVMPDLATTPRFGITKTVTVDQRAA
jgi:hypothetical protein